MIGLSLRDYHATETHHFLAPHCVTNDGEGILPDFLVWNDVVGRIEVTLVDVRKRNELINLDSVGTLDLERR